MFSGPYIKKVIDSVRQTHPNLPIILYISGEAGRCLGEVDGVATEGRLACTKEQ